MTRLLAHPHRIVCGIALTLAFTAVAITRTHAAAVLQLDTARVTLSGTSNVHPYEAGTTTVKVTRIKLAAEGADTLDALVVPGAIEAFDIAIPVATLTSPREGLDKNMLKALKADKFAEITFRLLRLERSAAPGAFRGTGTLTIAGVDKEVALDLTIRQAAARLTVKGEYALLMTDYGITPPKAMLGMLKTDPKVTITFEALLNVPVA